MTAPASPEAGDPWTDCLAAARLFAVDPTGLGAVLRSRPGPLRDRWLAEMRALAPPGTPWRRVPLGIADSRLLGGLDLAATLRLGAPVAERGVLAEADGGVVLLAMAERLPPATAARLAAVLDAGRVTVARDGFSLDHPARLGVLALDEGIEPDERPPAALLDRLALHLDLSGLGGGVTDPAPDLAAARARLPSVTVPEQVLEALCGTALALGVASARAPLFALRAARAAAALAGRSAVSAEDAALAARLVLASRATRLPAADPPPDSESPPPPPDQSEREDGSPRPDEPLQDMLLAATQAAIPQHLLAQLASGLTRARSRAEGRVGPVATSAARGRPAGVRAGVPRGGARLSVIETLRAATPWQRVRGGGPGGRLAIRAGDFRVIRRKRSTQTTTIFVVDASGSAALNRLAEAKGAVELLLAECYVRRDQVAVLGFRGRKAELLLPPTRSLVRAKRGLAGLPGGGGTPLAAGIDSAAALADAVRRRGGTPAVVLLTDGRANVARDGSAGRAAAEQDALASARVLRAAGLSALLIDTSPRPHPQARTLAEAMGARYVPLPYANAAALSQATQSLAAPGPT